MSKEGTIHGTGLEGSLDPEAEAGLAVMRHRAALAAGNWMEVDRTLDPHTWGSGDPGLLHRWAAEHGVQEAVERLRPFWRETSAQIEDVRVIDPEEVEVYEAVRPPKGRALRTVALIRRRGGHWRLVTTTSSADEILRLCVFGAPGSQPDVLPQDLLQWCGNLKVHGTRGMLDSLDGRFQLQIEAIDGFEARVDATVPEVQARLADGCAVVMLVGETPRELAARRDMMVFASKAGAECARRLGSDAVLLPSCDRILTHEQLDALGTDDVFHEWTGIYEDDEHVFSRGLAHARQPEIEVISADWADPHATVEVAIQWALHGQLSLEPESFAMVGGMEVYVQRGRRGPISGTTYGRWGSRLLRPVG